MSKWWHEIEHRMGWFSGHVVSRSNQQGRIFIGFMCDKCSRVTGEHDATNIIDHRIKAELDATGKDRP